MRELLFAVLLAAISLAPFDANAGLDGCKKYGLDNFDNGRPYQTKFGILELYECPIGGKEESVEYLVLGGHPIFREFQSLGLSEHSRAQDTFIYDGGQNRTSLLGPCTGTQYLLDLRGTRPRLVKFGIKNACNQMDKVLWKKDRVVINFNRDAKFEYLYSTGEMMLPKDDPDRYDPVFDENSPVIDRYVGQKKYPHIEYELAPPYANEVKLDW